MLLNDSEFIAALQLGESAAYQKLLIETQDFVYNTLLGIVQDATVAEDLAQEVYIQVFRSIGTFRGDAKLSTWIYRIAVTKALGWQRKQKGVNRWKNWFAGNEKIAVADFHHPGVQAEQKELAAILFKAIQLLPEQQRIAWILIKTEGLSYAETAEIMETTVKAIEALQHRAKANLRKYLQSYDSIQ